MRLPEQCALPLVLLCWPLLAHSAGGEVRVDRQKVQVERKTFDPAHPPADMPPLTHDEAAVTESRFDCAVQMSYRVLEHKPLGGRCITSMKVTGVIVTLQLKVTIWLPEDAPAKLSSHEEGHRQIAQRVYEGAQAVAAQIARSIDGQTLTGEGADCPAAEHIAAQQSADQFCRQYLDRTAARSGRVSDVYDQITAHGTHAEPPEDEAIRQAFAKDDKAGSGHPTSRK